MLRRSFVPCALALLSGCALLGRGAKETPQQAAHRVAEDGRIRAEVEGRIAAEPSLSAARMRVDVHEREVSLFGSVPGMGALRCATTNTELVQGVRLIIDHTELLPGPREVRCVAPRAFRTSSTASALPSPR
jgi:hypothetical protein